MKKINFGSVVVVVVVVVSAVDRSKNRTLARIRTYTLNGPILVQKMGLSPILDFCKGGPFSIFFLGEDLAFFFVFRQRSCISARLPTCFKRVNQPEVRIWSDFRQK